MQLTDSEKSMLDGRDGKAKQKAMELLVRYAEALGCERFVDTTNVAGVPGDERLSEAIGSTLLAELPEAWRWRPLKFNELMLGFDEEVGRDALLERVEAAPEEVGSLVPLFQDGLRPVVAVERPLTDDRAPVEWLTDRMIIDFISRGGELDEDYLPTRP